MSTCCRIGRVNEDGTVDSIYCHFDGYISGVGMKLHDHYNDYGDAPDRVDKLIALGDLSYLGEEPVSSAEQWTDARDYTKCIAYNDRGEHTAAVHHKSVEDFLKYCDSCSDIEYGYYYLKRNWHVSGKKIGWTLGFDL